MNNETMQKWLAQLATDKANRASLEFAYPATLESKPGTHHAGLAAVNGYSVFWSASDITTPVYLSDGDADSISETTRAKEQTAIQTLIDMYWNKPSYVLFSATAAHLKSVLSVAAAFKEDYNGIHLCANGDSLFAYAKSIERGDVTQPLARGYQSVFVNVCISPGIVAQFLAYADKKDRVSMFLPVGQPESQLSSPALLAIFDENNALERAAIINQRNDILPVLTVREICSCEYIAPATPSKSNSKPKEYPGWMYELAKHITQVNPETESTLALFLEGKKISSKDQTWKDFQRYCKLSRQDKCLSFDEENELKALRHSLYSGKEYTREVMRSKALVSAADYAKFVTGDQLIATEIKHSFKPETVTITGIKGQFVRTPTPALGDYPIKIVYATDKGDVAESKLLPLDVLNVGDNWQCDSRINPAALGDGEFYRRLHSVLYPFWGEDFTPQTLLRGNQVVRLLEDTTPEAVIIELGAWQNLTPENYEESKRRLMAVEALPYVYLAVIAPTLYEYVYGDSFWDYCYYTDLQSDNPALDNVMACQRALSQIRTEYFALPPHIKNMPSLMEITDSYFDHCDKMGFYQRDFSNPAPRGNSRQDIAKMLKLKGAKYWNVRTGLIAGYTIAV